MAGFCTKCGRPLQDGIPCSCTQTQSNVQPETYQQTNNQQGTYQQQNNQQGAYQQQNNQQGAYQQQNYQQDSYQQGAYQQQNNQQGTYQQGAYQQQNYQQATGNETFNNVGAQAGEYFNKFTNVSKGLFGNAIDLIKRPYDTTKSILQGNAKRFGIEAIAAKAIITFILMLLAYFIMEQNTYFKIDGKFKNSFVLALFSIGVDLILAGSMFLSALIFKSHVKFETMLGVAGIKAILDTMVIVLTIVLSMLNGTLAGMFYVFACLITFLFLFMAFNLSNSIDENKKIYAMSVAIIFMAIAFLVLLLLLRGMIGSSVNFGGMPSFQNQFDSFY